MQEADTGLVLYNVPASRAAGWQDVQMVIRAGDPAEITTGLAGGDIERVSYVQLLSLQGEVDAIAGWAAPFPVDLVMNDVEAQYPLLYKWSSVLARQPVRVSVPVEPGFVKAVKLAASLGFSVKLEAAQPAPPVIRELNQAVQLYLHHSNVAEPIEYFHGTLLAYYTQNPTTLWEIQEEHPARFRYVTDDGRETVSRRFAGTELSGDLASFPERWKAELVGGGAECRGCECLDLCAGYFKWPDRDYSCAGVRGVFRTLRSAAEELRADAARFDAAEEADGEE